MKTFILRENPSQTDDAWVFRVPQDAVARSKRPNFGKMVKFTSEKITLQTDIQLPVNRILHNDDPSKFILTSFADFRFPDVSPRISADYIKRLMKAGLFLNGTQYRFYHHSNSQLRGRSCFMRQANSDEELDGLIYQMGDFAKIMNVAKRAKRIGLLFSAADIDYNLDPRLTKDIPDLKVGDEVFSDGCGLASRRLLIQLSKKKKIIFRGVRYTPCVIQIRYRGYKGVLMLYPEMDQEKQCLAHFRGSMKKFTATSDTTFSVVEHSHPYSFGRLNNDIIVLLSSLGITNEALLKKQADYFEWIRRASEDLRFAVDFLSCLEQYSLAERVLLDGLQHPDDKEVSSFRKKDKIRARMMVHKSRLLFGVCDPYRVLKEGEVHVRITQSRQGATTLTNTDVLVVRNPCLHPGDCLKLRAVTHPKLAHLVDCVVFSSVARSGHKPAPAMTSGGDKFFVCWDPDLVPKTLSQSYDYPPGREFTSTSISRMDLANHFAAYNNSGVASVSRLHGLWARSSPKGALCTECQELNALHSQSVDGAPIKIPDRLRTPPQSKEKFIIDILGEAASEFENVATQSRLVNTGVTIPSGLSSEDAGELIVQLLASNQHAHSEYELFNAAYSVARKYDFKDFRRYLPHINFGALTTQEKYTISATLGLTPQEDAYIWNSLLRSDILTREDLEARKLGGPLRLQRLYSSKVHGLTSFFDYLQIASEEFERKLLILKTDDRFAVGIFIRGRFPWDEDPEVNDNVAVCSFLPHASPPMATFWCGTKGYRLYCGDGSLQLYDKQRGNTFIFVTRPGPKSDAEIITSIALQKISAIVQRQMGRMNRNPVIAIEAHVVSNRDRVAHQMFDLRFDHVATEEFIRRSKFESTTYTPNTLKDVDWEAQLAWMKPVFEQPVAHISRHLSTRTAQDLHQLMTFCFNYHAEDVLYTTFNVLCQRLPLDTKLISTWINRCHPLVFVLLKAFPPDESSYLHRSISNLTAEIVGSIIQSANTVGIACLVALEKIGSSIADLPLAAYLELLMRAALCIRTSQLVQGPSIVQEDRFQQRSSTLTEEEAATFHKFRTLTVQEVLMVLNDCRARGEPVTKALSYAHNHALAIAFDRAEEAADECPCDANGKPRSKQRQKAVPARLFCESSEEPLAVKAHVRIDLPSSARVNSHVRLQSVSEASKGVFGTYVLDGIVRQETKGELKIQLLSPPPPEMGEIEWKLFNAGSVATAEAMVQAVQAISVKGSEACRFHRQITGQTISGDDTSLNPSQEEAVRSSDAQLSLIWGPPGTGKTTVVVQILRRLLKNDALNDCKILMTASTHNAVDNVLERFLVQNKKDNLLPDDKILRVATDSFKVNKALRSYTVDAKVGGDIHQNNRLLSQAEKRVKEASIVFTTCAGAGLGILRKLEFEIVLIDEASQISEPCALIPLAKGCHRAILVGDHVQLRPTVKPMAKLLNYDVSLLERLWPVAGQLAGVKHTMLDVQYRFPKELAAFPSREFYEGRLKSHIQDSESVLRVLGTSTFPWPKAGRTIIPTVFVPCATEEDMGGMSKSNDGQVAVVNYIISLLQTPLPGAGSVTPAEVDANPPSPKLSIAVLSPYSKQVKQLQSTIPSSAGVTAHTIDSFQGRESDIIIFTTVRCNVSNDIGFVEDERRLNVAWTRARLGLIIVGDRRTLSEGSELWKRAVGSCAEVVITLPPEPEA
ncbi:hypothetical protein JAAARDRAFT_61145 [Jaapia argillacea MUCL 33604]|uniref:Uncharacterized protein n=1 Tax=Jaapia argillacea MUCL 33604 TaxID=933084 RepID=A0A067PTW3_9AGAM|nr:hypothetical protein JAAARDRAFT_61145 [Jaapia argillacea MUCL 33604]